MDDVEYRIFGLKDNEEEFDNSLKGEYKFNKIHKWNVQELCYKSKAQNRS